METTRHRPERTCIGCRNTFPKDAVVRLVPGPSEILIDYREKLPGRAAYVCPKRECIQKALRKDAVTKALRTKIRPPQADEFVLRLKTVIEEKIRALIAMSAKSGKLAAGYSAVHDALEKGRVEMILFARDLSEGTKDKVSLPAIASVKQATLFSRSEFGGILNRDLVGVIAIEEKGLADALWKETERLKGLINVSE
jgi:uncharacterized protein